MRTPLPTAPRLSGSFLVVAGAVLWGTTGTAQALAPQGTDPAVVGAVRLAIGGPALLALALASGTLTRGGRWPLRATLVGGLAVATYQLSFFAGVARTGVAVGTIVAIGSAPIAAGLLGLLVRGERPNRRWGIATVLAVAGCGLLLGTGIAGGLTADALGVALALGAGASYATYAVVSKGLLEQHAPDAVMAVIFCLGALVLSPLLVVGDLTWLADPRGLAVGLHLGLIATGASYALFARGLRAIPVATAATLSLAEPLTAGTLGVVLLGEHLTVPAAVGIALLLAGLALLSVGRQEAVKQVG